MKYNHKGSVTLDLIMATTLVVIIVLAIYSYSFVAVRYQKSIIDVQKYQGVISTKLTTLEISSPETWLALAGTTENVDGIQIEYGYNITGYNTYTLEVETTYRSINKTYTLEREISIDE